MRPIRSACLAAALAVLAAPLLTGCGDPGGDPDTVKVVYQRSTDNKYRIMDDYLAAVKKEFERTHPGKRLRLMPVQAAENDYATKVQQMMRSPRTAPDLVREDSAVLDSDVTSGYLRPLDDKLAGWRDWPRYLPAAKEPARAEDGRTYGVPDGTDTRGLWFNKELFARAGLPADWQPRTWQDVLDAARTVGHRLPGVIPFHLYTGKGPGEATSMQGFEMLLYGTGKGPGMGPGKDPGKDPLYDPARKKWLTGSRSFRDALAFVRTVYAERLGPDPADALDPNVSTRVGTDWLPSGKLAIALDGNWLPKLWERNGAHPWPRWDRVMGRAAFPTQDGAAPGRVSLSGGWTWAISARSRKADLAWQVIETLQSRRNALDWTVRDGQIAVRDDVAADPVYRSYVPGIDFFTALMPYARHRPALPVYPQVSGAIQEATEAVATGNASVAEAARDYDEALRSFADTAEAGP
ncbi:extracellular solute-binding protein [Streptomyces luteireticuli]|uniref:Extracellular solute-binding protein n=1 Tax=Streptomyces luteireticuli TaxID=173858 RepID=A0ABN0Y987_9ACTN